MGYGRSGYRRGYSSRPQTTGRIAKANARPGPCKDCGEEIPAGAGQLWRESDGSWSVVHRPAEWAGSPVSGQYSGGCPAETDRMNEQGHFGGPSGAGSERDRIASYAAIYAASAPERPAPRRSYARTSSRYAGWGRCTHEDYPCCGCGE
jgi:hypothetical protein